MGIGHLTVTADVTQVDVGVGESLRAVLVPSLATECTQCLLRLVPAGAKSYRETDKRPFDDRADREPLDSSRPVGHPLVCTCSAAISAIKRFARGELPSLVVQKLCDVLVSDPAAAELHARKTDATLDYAAD